jgi:hypothetical protein
MTVRIHEIDEMLSALEIAADDVANADGLERDETFIQQAVEDAIDTSWAIEADGRARHDYVDVERSKELRDTAALIARMGLKTMFGRSPRTKTAPAPPPGPTQAELAARFLTYQAMQLHWGTLAEDTVRLAEAGRREAAIANGDGSYTPS